MHIRCAIILLIQALHISGTLLFVASNRRYTLYGQVIYPRGLSTTIQRGSRLVVELHDISVTDALTVKIAEQDREARAFPIVFSIHYNPMKIARGNVHVLNVRVVNRHNEILFVNERRIEVRLLGKGRTTFIDVPVVPIAQNDAIPYLKLREWPHLVGKPGEEAVAVIKEETGFTQVFVVTRTTKLSKDMRYDRVCIFVDDNGNVLHVPRTG